MFLGLALVWVRIALGWTGFGLGPHLARLYTNIHISGPSILPALFGMAAKILPKALEVKSTGI